jgi:type I restriction enzyme S subunit
MEIKEGYNIPKGCNNPRGWNPYNLGEIANVVGGGTPSSVINEYWQGEINWFTPTEISDKKYYKYSKRKISLEGLNNSSAKLLPPGTILLTSRASIGDVGILMNEASTNQGFQSLVVNNKADNEFLYYLISFIKPNLISLSKGSTFLEIGSKDIKSIAISLPPLAEQEAIAEVLSDTDALIESLEAKIKKKKAIKKGAMQKLLQPQPHWESKTLGEVCDIKKGQLITANTLISGNIPVIAGGKTPAYYHKFPNRKANVITISASGASAGYVSFHNYEIFASDCSTIESNNTYNIKFVFYLLLSQQYEIYKTQTGGAQPHVHAKDISPLNFSWPSLPEQKIITQALSDIDAELELLEDKLNKYRSLKEGLMQELLTGRIRLV